MENKDHKEEEREVKGNSEGDPFFMPKGSVRKCKVDLSRYFHTPDMNLTQRFNVLYRLFEINDEKLSSVIGISKTTMNRYRRGVWIPNMDMKIIVAQAMSKLARYTIDSAVIWGDTLIWEKFRKNIREDNKK